MKLKDLIPNNNSPKKYIETSDGPVKICTSGKLPNTNFTVGPYTSDKYSDKIIGYDKKQFYIDYIKRLLPETCKLEKK